jgi:hypothetical protein
MRALAIHRLAGLAAVLLVVPTRPATAQPATFFACFVPSVGAIYMIKRTGLPQACLGATHVEITWTDGAGAVALGGPGAATSAARSDHRHQLTNVSNTAVGLGGLAANTTGIQNTAVGFDALLTNTAGGRNTAVGTSALVNNTTASGNTALGNAAMIRNTTGAGNTGLGAGALSEATTGSDNTGVGENAMFFNATGARNTALGRFALDNMTTGDDNIGIGYDAGGFFPSGSRNIYIGSSAPGSESDRIRIGNAGNAAVRTFVAGIQGVGIAGGTAVLVASDGQLGIASSSRRFKEDIRPIGDAAARALMQLRPVGFRYIEPTADGRKPQHYGLIAEEVAEVLPELVARDSAGVPLTVYYQFLPVLMLDELQRQARELESLRAALAAQAAAMEELRAEVRRIHR